MNSVIINADDLGMTPGANKAIFDAYDRGKLTHASIMTNCDYFEEAVNGARDRKGLGVGVHLNLSYGRAILASELLHNEEGIFNKGFVSLYFAVRRDKKLFSDIKKELEAQIVRAFDYGICVTHLDSHRHIHMIPEIYKITNDLSRKYAIPRVRVVNENLVESVKLSGTFDVFSNGGILKYLLLKYFAKKNLKEGFSNERSRFFSILFTGKISRMAIENILKSNSSYEIMVHPGYSEIDKKVKFYDESERRYRASKDRDLELKELLKVSV